MQVSGGAHRSPPRGGFDMTASNQQLLVDEPDEEALVLGTSGREISTPFILSHILSDALLL